MAYKCDSCGNTSEEQKDCCGAPMKEVTQSDTSADAPESTDAPATE